MTAREDLFARHRPLPSAEDPDDVPGGNNGTGDHDAATDPGGHSQPEAHDRATSEDHDRTTSEDHDPDQSDDREQPPPQDQPLGDEDEGVAIDAPAQTPAGSAGDDTVVMPLAAAAIARPAARTGPRRAGVDSWDTDTIRRWDPSLTDQRLAASTGPVRRPSQLDDREDVQVERESNGGRWWEIPVMVITALTLAFLLRTFVVQVFYIPSGSMIPTLQINDRIAVEKISYLTREPARGEVIVFAGDEPPAGEDDDSVVEQIVTGVGQFLGVVPVDAKDFVKRVIGLPGDTVTITDGRVSVNGVQLDEPYARLDNDDGEWEVPPGMLFVMGDNRANSGDSRSTLGYIPEEDVVGRAVMVIWPFDHAGSIPGVNHDAAVDAGS